jgi:hydroxymethylglutaryl-CoA lyase
VALEPTDLYVADTIGAATPAQVADLCARTRARWPRLRLSVHLHGAADARALACAVAAVRAGAVQIEASVCGLGGPVVRSPGSALVGNLATEALVATCDRLGIETGLDPGAVAAAARDVAALLGLPPGPAGPPAAEVQRLAGAA